MEIPTIIIVNAINKITAEQYTTVIFIFHIRMMHYAIVSRSLLILTHAYGVIQCVIHVSIRAGATFKAHFWCNIINALHTRKTSAHQTPVSIFLTESPIPCCRKGPKAVECLREAAISVFYMTVFGLPGGHSQFRMSTSRGMPPSLVHSPPFRQPHTSSRGLQVPV